MTKDSIDELNYILGKLVPTQPDGIGGEALTLTGTAGNARLCQGFTPINNTGGSLTPTAGTLYTRNTDSTITTNYLTEYGPGDSGTVTGFVNSSVGVGTTLNISFGLYAVNPITEHTEHCRLLMIRMLQNQQEILELLHCFMKFMMLRLINAASPDGFNKAFITHGSAANK